MKKYLICLIAALCLAAGFAAAEGLTDGEYVPDRFAFEGGTGKVTITCPRVLIRDGQARADILFSSAKYTKLTVDGTAYEPTVTGEGALFTIPAPINEAFEVTGTTTAMSQPHDIAYTLMIGLGDGLGGLQWTGRMDLAWAECFNVDYFEGGYAMISVGDGRRYLLTPEGGGAPEGLDPEIIVLERPADRVYMAATSVMAFYDRLGALGDVRFSALKEEGWTVENAAAAMRSGDILFAGKYSEPDYEALVKGDCDLAIESTMILHTPKVQELLELLGIPVFIDRSSYESHPLGRAEWIKAYGVIASREAEAEAFFAALAATAEENSAGGSTGLKVGYFYINASGEAVIRGKGDYISRMIEMGGGVNAFSELGVDGKATAAVSMESFYNLALDADYLIYSTSIDTGVKTMDDLLSLSPLMADLKAVKEGRVYVAGSDLYQATDRASLFIGDIKRMLSGGEGQMEFLNKLQ